MTAVYAYLAMTLDGFIADSDESVAFLDEVAGLGDNGFSDFYSDVDLVIMGANTFRWLIKNDVKENPYADKRVLVISHDIIETDWEVAFFKGDLVQLASLLAPYDKVWIVGGGVLISEMLNRQMLDYLVVTVAPYLLNSGTPLFNQLVAKTKLTLCGVKQFNQFVELKYEVVK